MKIYLQVVIALFFMSELSAQASLEEDFEAYNDGDNITIISKDWDLWTGGTDAHVVSDKSASGKNSLMLEGGKNTDIYFPFKNRFTAGSIQLSIDLQVPKGKVGYFNLQGQEKPGAVWSMQCYLDKSGFFRMMDDNVCQLQDRYPQGQWFNFSVDINFDTHLWRFYIDGECVGAYTQDKVERQSIASLALYASDEESLFYVDNIVFNHSGKAKKLKLKKDAAITKMIDPNADLTRPITNSFVGINGQEQNLGCTIKNTGKKKIKSFELAIESAGKIETKEYQIQLKPGIDTLLSIDKKFVFDNHNPASISITNINGRSDKNTCNNTIPIDLQGYTFHPDKKVWVEEATGTWCGWCPRGSVHMKYLSKKYPDQFVGISVHNNDPMEVPNWMGRGGKFQGRATESGDGLAQLIKGFPSAVVEREDVMDPAALEMAFLESSASEPLGTISHSAILDTASRELKIIIITEINHQITQDVKLVVGLTEDNVSGSGREWGQMNFYANRKKGSSDTTNKMGPMGGYELLPPTIPDSEMEYHHVGRVLLTPFKGESIKENMSASGQSIISKTYTHVIPEEWDINKMNIVSGLIVGSMEIDNANKTSIAEAISNNNK